MPFTGINANEILLENKRNEINYEELKKYQVSEKAINFIKELTEPDPLKRLSAKDALKHEWLIKENIYIFK